MPQDALNYQYLTYELSNFLVGGRIDKIFMPEPYTILLHIKAKDNYTLLLSCNPSCARINITNMNIENPLTPFSFLMHLRKRILGGNITDIKQIPYERVINIDITTKTPLGDTEKYTLITEIMGRYSNILLVNEDNIITECVFHSPDMTAKRIVLPSVKYTLPPSQDKYNISQEKELLDYFALYKEGNLQKYIMAKLSGLAPSSIKEGLSNISTITPENILNSIKSLYNQPFFPCVYQENNVIKDFSAFNYKSINGEQIKCNTLSESMDKYFASISYQNHFSNLGKQLLTIVKTALNHSNNKLINLTEKIKDCQDYEEDKLYGELLTAYIYLIKVGMDKITVNNYYTNEDITITLDKTLSPQANANKYYKAYNKKKKTISYVTEQIEQTKNEIDYYQSLLSQFDNIVNNNELNDFKQELIISKLIKQPKGKNKKPISVSKPLSLVVDGYNVKIGKNNLQNDILVKKAKDNYTWLHPQKIHGSHTIIEGENIPLSTIEKVASYSAYYSKACQSQNVPIDYTLVKYVKKPQNSLPGKVIYTHQKTVYVTPQNPQNK